MSFNGSHSVPVVLAPGRPPGIAALSAQGQSRRRPAKGACASELAANRLCLTDVTTIPALTVEQEVFVPVSPSPATGGRAMPFLSQHVIVVGHTP